MSAVSSKSSSQLVTQPTRHTVKLSNGQLVIQSTHNAASWSQSSCHVKSWSCDELTGSHSRGLEIEFSISSLWK